jgi:hypothetical protein
MKINPGVVEHCLVDTSKWERNTTGANGARGGRVLRFRARRRGRRVKSVSTQDEVSSANRLALVVVSVGPVAAREVLHEQVQGEHAIYIGQAKLDALVALPSVALKQTSVLRDALQQLSDRLRRYSVMLGVAAKNRSTESIDDGQRVWS